MTKTLKQQALAGTAFTLVLIALINPHTHVRENTKDNRKLTADLIRLAVEGGAAVLGPMPNTADGLLTAEQVAAYINERKKDGKKARFVPGFIPIVQITERTTKADINACVKAGIFDAKIYPLDRTTQSQNGVRDYEKLIPILQHAGTKKMRIHVHPEHPLMQFVNRDAEYQFLGIMDMFMRATAEYGTVFVWEHGTDARCIPFWKKWATTERFYLTLTAHHLVTNEDDTFGDVQATCKPPIKTSWDQEALVGLVAEGNNWVMAGGDDAPHPKDKKHVHGKCACGAYTAPFLYALYAHALSRLLTTKKGVKVFGRFMYGNAARLYRIKLQDLPKVVLTKAPQQIPKTYQAGSWTIESFWGGKTIDYSMEYVEG